MANKFVSWLEHAASDVGKAALFTVQHILPIAGKVLVAAEPFVALAFPAEGPLLAAIAAKITTAQNKFPVNGSGNQRLQWVLQEVEGDLLPLAQKAGLTGQDATDEITKYINALVAILNGPTITIPPAAQTT